MRYFTLPVMPGLRVVFLRSRCLHGDAIFERELLVDEPGLATKIDCLVPLTRLNYGGFFLPCLLTSLSVFFARARWVVLK